MVPRQRGETLRSVSAMRRGSITLPLSRVDQHPSNGRFTISSLGQPPHARFFQGPQQ